MLSGLERGTELWSLIHANALNYTYLANLFRLAIGRWRQFKCQLILTDSLRNKHVDIQIYPFWSYLTAAVYSEII